jgi:hypothetical protein
MEDLRTWAEEEFGQAELGDTRRVARLVKVAAAAARQPAGQITEVFTTSAEREGAFRLVENDEVDASAIARASYEACARRCAEHEFVYVAVDGTSLNITDENGSKGTGVVGSRQAGARGFQVMTALAVAPNGVPMGLCGQTWWARVERSTRRKERGRDKRPLMAKETRHWLTVMKQVRSVFPGEAGGPTPWFQLDRGGDAWPVILDGLEPGQRFTVRATYDRRLRVPDGSERRYLRETVSAQPLLGTYKLDVAAGPNRSARLAEMQLRACRVTLDFLVGSKRRVPGTLWVLWVSESLATTPAGEKPIEWLLLTTHAVESEADARLVVYGYSQRWRIEEFHRLWKSGACCVEDTQLRAADHIERWASVLAAVAVRLLRLTYLARVHPELPATNELTPAEVKAVLLARNLPNAPTASPTVAQIVRWLAEIGGYVGHRTSGPPGALTLARGLQRIRVLADVLERNDQW